MKLLGNDKKPNKLSFHKEVQNLEFIETIGNMNSFFCIDSNERDKVLVKIGKKLFKNHPERKISRIRITKKVYFEVSLVREPLSQEEIDEMLRPVDYKDKSGT
jgi:hypothetical protein